MGTNPTFNRDELKLLLITVLKIRSILFDVVEIKFDKRSMKKISSVNPIWKDDRGTLPILDDIDKLLAIARLHVNSEETVNLYDVMGVFDRLHQNENIINNTGE